MITIRTSRKFQPSLWPLWLCVAAFWLTGCAQYLPVPGGDETTNRSFYETDHDFLKTLESLNPGMAETDVFVQLHRQRDDFIKLERSEIVQVLYGGSGMELKPHSLSPEPARHLLHSLYGYKFDFKVVERSHGFSSPIRIRTNEAGYNYTVYLIFQNGRLFEAPVLSGGHVNKTSSGTIFDYLTPSTLMRNTLE